MASSAAYSGRAPKAVKATHWLVPFRQALMLAVWPSASGPTVSVCAAMPAELVVTEAGLGLPIPEVGFCHATLWPLSGTPLLSTSASTVHVKVAPAASDSCRGSTESVAGVPPTN